MSRVQRNSINILKVIAAFMVFMLHSTIFEPDLLILLASNKFAFIFVPSAWAGVWIFFIVGGYLAGKGFSLGRYQLSKEGIKKYYIQRLKKVVIPTMLFIIICVLLIYPDFVIYTPNILLKYILFSYNGTPGVDGIGATWYVSQLIFFYLISPGLAFLAHKFLKGKKLMVGIFIGIMVILGFLYRLFGYYIDLDWYTNIYTPWYGNIDLFVSGFLLAYIDRKSESRVVNMFSVLLLFIIIFVNCFFYRRMLFGDSQATIYNLYFFQSIYLIGTLFYLYSFSNADMKMDQENNNIFLRIINKFSTISFEFYLLHSLVLHLWASFIQTYIDVTTILGHIEYMFIIAIIAIFLSILLKQLFEILM